MKTVALVTYKESSRLSASDVLLIDPLKMEGFDASAVAWDDKRVDWKKFDCIILRSCWNYHYRYTEFLAWLSFLESIKVTTLNPLSVIRWNSHKRYLKDLDRKGVSTIPTMWVKKGTSVNLQKVASEAGWTDVVIKPCVGASAYEVFLSRHNEHDKTQSTFNTLTGKGDVMIQPLAQEGMTEGEYSFIFIGGIYSHTVLKLPKKDEFRSNYNGNTLTLTHPHQKLINQAKHVLSAIQTDTLYARIDGINQNGRLILMELELIEPSLFFDMYPTSSIAFARELKKRSR